jgi:hypothetical protein
MRQSCRRAGSSVSGWHDRWVAARRWRRPGLGDAFAGPPILRPTSAGDALVRGRRSRRRCAGRRDRGEQTGRRVSPCGRFSARRGSTPTAAYDVLGAVRCSSSVARRRAAGTLDPTADVAVEFSTDGTSPRCRSRIGRAAAASRGALVAAQTQRVRSFAPRVRDVCVRSFNHPIGHGAQYLLLLVTARATSPPARRRLACCVPTRRATRPRGDAVDAYLRSC